MVVPEALSASTELGGACATSKTISLFNLVQEGVNTGALAPGSNLEDYKRLNCQEPFILLNIRTLIVLAE